MAVSIVAAVWEMQKTATEQEWEYIVTEHLLTVLACSIRLSTIFPSLTLKGYYGFICLHFLKYVTKLILLFNDNIVLIQM